MIPIVFSTDHNFIMPTGVAILSMLECSSDVECDIFVLQASDVTDDDRKSLQRIVSFYPSRITFISMGEQFSDWFEIRGITTAAYYRLFIPWLIPQYDKIIYCDGDVVFCDTVKGLYELPLGDNYVAGFCLGATLKYALKIGVEALEYINSGVLLINAKKHRELDLDQEYLRHAKSQYVFQDQDIINIVCNHHIACMPIRYNCLPYVTSNNRGDNSNNPCIIHYAGAKPWNVFTYSWTKWWDVYRRSPFFDEELEYEIADKTLHPVYTTRMLFSFFIKKNIPWLFRLKENISNKWLLL